LGRTEVQPSTHAHKTYHIVSANQFDLMDGGNDGHDFEGHSLDDDVLVMEELPNPVNPTKGHKEFLVLLLPVAKLGEPHEGVHQNLPRK